MSEYRLEDCSLYQIKEIAGKPICIFDDHNMALPVWGTYSNRIGLPMNLVSFDYHTDTHMAFNCYIHNETGSAIAYNMYGLKNPYIKNLLRRVHFSISDFSFEDIFALAVGYLKNTEQIITSCDFGYLSSYMIVNRTDGEGESYEVDDRLNGYRATYISKESLDRLMPEKISDPIAVDFDLDFFGSLDDYDDRLKSKIAPLIKRATVITIAREESYFESCKVDKSFRNEDALQRLLDFIRDILS